MDVEQDVVGAESALQHVISEGVSQISSEMDSAVTTNIDGKRQADMDENLFGKKIKLEEEGIILLPQIQNTIKFYGRQTELNILQSAIDGDDKTKEIDVAISGLPGIGKTQLVLQFIKDNLYKFKHVIWIDGKDIQNSVDKLHNLALHLNIIDKQYDITNSNNYYLMLTSLYTKLNEYKSLIVFDNVLLVTDVNKYFHVETTMKNIMIIVISRFIIDIATECNLSIKLQGLDEQSAKLMLTENINHIENLNIDDLAIKLSCHPLALIKIIKIVEYRNKIENCDANTVSKLLDNANMILKFTENTLNNSRNSSLYTRFNTLIQTIPTYQYGNIAKHILTCISYIDHKNIDIPSLFSQLYQHSNISDEIVDLAVGILESHSFVTREENDNLISILSITQLIVRNLSPENKMEVIKTLLSLFKSKMSRRNVGAVPTIDDSHKPHIMKIFREYVYDNVDFIKTYALMFLESSYTSTEIKLKNINYVFDRLEACNAISIELQYLYTKLLIKSKKFTEVIKYTSRFIKNSNDNVNIDTEMYGLLIWYYRSYAYNELNETEKAWTICKNVFIRMTEKYGFRKRDIKNTLQCMILLAEIAFKNEQTYIDYCKNLTKHIFGTYMDWITVGHIESEYFSVFKIITKYYINNGKVNIALEFLNNMNLKIQLQIEIMETNIIFQDILTTLSICKFECLTKLDKYFEAFDEMVSLFDDILDGIHFLFEYIDENMLLSENRFKALCEFVNYSAKIDTVEYYKIALKTIEIIQSIVLENEESFELVIELYDDVQNVDLNISGEDKDPYIVMCKLQQALVFCEHIENINDAWDVYKNAFNETCLAYGRTDIDKEKPESRTVMKSLITDALKHVEVFIANNVSVVEVEIN